MTKSAKYTVVEEPWDFSVYSQGEWKPGASLFRRLLWTLVSLTVFESGWVPLSSVKRFLLRCFGASIGDGVVIKPNVRIKFPWRLVVEDQAWIGQEVWIDNLETVTIGQQCCLSQGVYLCTGSHEFRRKDFRLACEPIHLGRHVWLCARTTVLPGVTVPDGRVIPAGQTIHKKMDLGHLDTFDSLTETE